MDGLKNGLGQGVVSFVKSVKSTLGSDVGANYEEFKTKLIGTSNLTSIPTEGNNLLIMTYELIKENADDNEIIAKGFNAFKLATTNVLNNEASNQNPSKTLIMEQKLYLEEMKTHLEVLMRQMQVGPPQVVEAIIQVHIGIHLAATYIMLEYGYVTMHIY